MKMTMDDIMTRLIPPAMEVLHQICNQEGEKDFGLIILAVPLDSATTGETSAGCASTLAPGRTLHALKACVESWELVAAANKGPTQ